MGAPLHLKWSDERVARLRELWTEGLSASQIARDLGGVTRSAVCGKADRLELQSRVSTKGLLPRVPHSAPRANAVPHASPKPVLDAPQSLSLNIEALTHKHCRYPYGDAFPFSFCGQPVNKIGESWCEFHKRVVFNKQPASAEQITRAIEARLKSSLGRTR